MKFILAIALMLGAFAPAAAQQMIDPTTINGTCDPKSGVRFDDGKLSQFGCNVALVVKTARGTVLIQFADKTGDDGRLLGFGGVIEGKQGFGADNTQMVAVQRLYFGTDAPVDAIKGTCILNWTGLKRTGGKLTSIVCGGMAEVEGQNIKATAFMQAR